MRPETPGRMWRGWWCVFVVVGASGMSAQTTFSFRFEPAAGARFHTIYEADGPLVFVGFSEIGDSSTGAIESMVSITERVSEVLTDASTVLVTYDSSRARYRTTSHGRWVPLELPRRAVGPTRVLLDQRMNASPLDDPSDPWMEKVLRGLVAVPALPLPTDPVTPGRPWSSAAALPYAIELPGDPATVVAITLEGRATMVLDSLVDRGSDTLAYVTARGGMNPIVVDSAYVRDSVSYPVTLWGSFAGVLLWSTGWKTWASGMITTRVHHRVEATSGHPPPETTMLAEVTSRFRLRP